MGKNGSRKEKKIQIQPKKIDEYHIKSSIGNKSFIHEIKEKDIKIVMSQEGKKWATRVFKDKLLTEPPLIANIQPWYKSQQRDNSINSILVSNGITKENANKIIKKIIIQNDELKAEWLANTSKSSDDQRALEQEKNEIKPFLEDAEKVLKAEKPLKFLVASNSQRHIGDSKLIAALILSPLAILVNAIGHRFITGPSEKGKTDVCNEVGKILPVHIYESLIGSTAKSKIYAFLNDSSVLEKKVFYYDDTKNNDPEFRRLIRILKDMEPGDIKVYETVIDKEYIKIKITGNCAVWESAVDLPSDKQDYSRALICKVEESEEHDCKIDCKTRELAGKDISYNIPNDYFICKAIFYLIIHEKIPGVIVPYWRRIDGVKGGRANKIFMGLIKGHALLNCYQRERNSDGKVIACEEDFNVAKGIFSAFSEKKNLTSNEQNVLGYLPLSIDENSDLFTISSISHILDLSYSRTSQILRNLESKGFASFSKNPEKHREKWWYKFDVVEEEITLLPEGDGVKDEK